MNRGFTLIELIATMAVMAILLGIGVPSFLEVVRNSRLGTDYNEVVGALYLARSEAIKGSDNVTVCARKNDTTCGSDWNNGLLVFADAAGLKNPAAQVADPRDILRIIEPVSDDNYIIAQASDDRTPPLSVRKFIRYGSAGASSWGTGTFQVCSGDTEEELENARALNVVVTGDLRPGRPVSDTSRVPMDVFKNAIDCAPTS